MPLTGFQRTLLADLAVGREDGGYLGYLAGGAALHFAPNSTRYSNDLDFFHDSIERVAAAFASDSARLAAAGYHLHLEFSQPGFIRATVARGGDTTRLDWAHDSAWRFMPLVRDELGGLLLHPVDLAINKLLALVGRREPRDFVDMLFVHATILPVGAVCWAAVGKDPGLSPLSLLDLLRRLGFRTEEFDRLQLAEPFDLPHGLLIWRDALAAAEEFVRQRPPKQIGCLYWSSLEQRFVMPGAGASATAAVPHYGAPGGVLPQVGPAS